MPDLPIDKPDDAIDCTDPGCDAEWHSKTPGRRTPEEDAA